MHAIIIPHRDRTRFLYWCLASIATSQQVTKITDYRVLVIDGGSVEQPARPEQGKVYSYSLGREFNKAVLLNVGIETALHGWKADVITFLDADAIVGPRWLEGVRCLDAPCLTRLCYRVKFLPMKHFEALDRYRSCPEHAHLMIRGLFREWETFPTSGEFWGSPDEIYQGPHPPPPVGPHVFGTSQFSIRSDVLGNLRYDERFVGRGYEDQWFFREIWRRAGDRYCAALLTDPDFAMLHVHEPLKLTPGHPWNSQEALDRNKALYEST